MRKEYNLPEASENNKTQMMYHNSLLLLGAAPLFGPVTNSNCRMGYRLLEDSEVNSGHLLCSSVSLAREHRRP
jgi:hypothetical protein